MLKRFRIPTLALAASMAVAVPTFTFARDRGESRGHEQAFRGREFHEGHEDRWRGEGFRRGYSNLGFGVYAAPAPAPGANGYYDQYGVWHPYGYYDQFGVWHPYGY
jgi:hypothetical protein